jgi:hypothetical protein
MAKQEVHDYNMCIPQTWNVSVPCSVCQGYIAKAKHMFNMFLRRPEARNDCAAESQQLI